MNIVCLIGRLTDAPSISEKGDSKVARYNLAVDRFKEGADFPTCVAFGKQADFVEKYLKKGMKISVIGKIRTGSYTNNEGKKVYTTAVYVDHHEFCEKKQEDKPETGTFTDMPDDLFNPFDE